MNRERFGRRGAMATAALAAVLFGASFPWAAARPRPAQAPSQDVPAALIEPAQLAETLAQAKNKPVVVNVGFKVLYEGAHVAGAVYEGPGRTGEGIDALTKWAQNLPRDKELVIYCGCCPWDKCPNIRPAYAALEKMGFSKLKVMHVEQDFAKDWMEKGYPAEKK